MSLLTVLGSASGSSGVTSAFGTAVDTVKGDVMGMIGVALPVGLAIMGTFIAVKLGVRFFRNVSGEN